MKKLILKWVLAAVALAASVFLAGLVFSGKQIYVETNSVVEALGLFVGVVLLSLVNATLGKLLKLLVLPLNCLTLGLLSVVINGLLFWMVGSWGFGFIVTNFWAGLVGSVLYSALNALLGIFLPDEEKS
jgi:putative membrane protein